MNQNKLLFSLTAATCFGNTDGIQALNP